MNTHISYSEAPMNQNSNLIFHQVLQSEDCKWQLDSSSNQTIIVPTGKLTAGLYFLLPVESNLAKQRKSMLIKTKCKMRRKMKS